MFTLTVKLKGMTKAKTYYFQNPDEAEKYADILQVEGILGTLGYDRSVHLGPDLTHRNHVELFHLH